MPKRGGSLPPLLAVMMGLVAAPLVAAQDIPRMPGGKPNLNGIWQAMNTANWNVEDHPAQPGPLAITGAIGAVPAGLGIIEGRSTIPYKPDARKQRDENFKNRAREDPEAKCFQPGVPRANYMPYPFQIIQSTGDILLSYSYDAAARVVMMQKHREAEIDTWMGTNNGHWEGDMLVVDVTGFNGRAWLDRAGNFASDTLHVVERYTMLDANTIHYEATIEDPATYTEPWKIGFQLYRNRDKNQRLLLFQCVEFAEEMLYGEVTWKPK